MEPIGSGGTSCDAQQSPGPITFVKDPEPCCKCAAYREIIVEMTEKMATWKKQLECDRQRAGWMVSEVDTLIGKK